MIYNRKQNNTLIERFPEAVAIDDDIIGGNCLPNVNLGKYPLMGRVLRDYGEGEVERIFFKRGRVLKFMISVFFW